MKIEVGKTYVDASGNKVRIVCIDRKTPGPQKIVGLLSKPNNEAVMHYTEEGRGYMIPNLVREYKEPSYSWINVHTDGRTDGSFSSRASADSWAASDLMMWGATKGKRIGLIRVDTETGKSENISLEA